jgi:hypothetical protein
LRFVNRSEVLEDRKKEVLKEHRTELILIIILLLLVAVGGILTIIRQGVVYHPPVQLAPASDSQPSQPSK